MQLRGSLACLTMSLALVAGGCGKAPGSEEEQRSTFDVRSTPSPPDMHRAGGQQLAMIVGSRCGEPGRMQYLGDRQGRAYYSLECGHATFLVGMGPDGAGHALTCAEAGRQGTQCWTKW